MCGSCVSRTNCGVCCEFCDGYNLHFTAKSRQGNSSHEASIPKDGSAGAFGYGIITDQGVLIVTTNHKGVLDSEAQHGDANNPVFHNHYGTLRADNRCGDDPAVFQIS